MQANIPDFYPIKLAPDEKSVERLVKFKDIYKCTKTDDSTTVKKIDDVKFFLESEVCMMSWASGRCHVIGPTLQGYYLEGRMRVMEMSFDSGVPLDKVWKTLTSENQKLIKGQLRDQIEKMRESKKPLIGRLGWEENISITKPYFDPYHPDDPSYFITYFSNEAEFDNYKIEQLRLRAGDKKAQKLADLIQPLRADYANEFVLTHGDLHAGNIHLRKATNSKGKVIWVLSAILDWGRSGFYPAYMEYAVAMKDGPYDPYWQKVMREVLKDYSCSKKRVAVEEMATYWRV
jgi:Phosphotransferase enzyme family